MKNSGRKKYPILFDTDRVNFSELNSYDEIIFLFKEIFGRKFDYSYLDWMNGSPKGPNKWYGAFDKDEPIGMYGLLPISISIGTVEYAAALCNNVGIVPAFRRKGLFQALGEYALSDANLPLVVGVPNSKSVKGHKRIGWKSYGTLELLRGKLPRKYPEYNTVDKFEYSNLVPKEYFFVRKDLDFIKWRYSKPGIEYRQILSNENTYIIWKIYEGRHQVLETNNLELLNQIGGIIDIWQFEGSIESNFLKNQGFEPVMSNEFILYTDIEFPEDLNINNFRFELGDNDVF